MKRLILTTMVALLLCAGTAQAGLTKQQAVQATESYVTQLYAGETDIYELRVTGCKRVRAGWACYDFVRAKGFMEILMKDADGNWSPYDVPYTGKWTTRYDVTGRDCRRARVDVQPEYDEKPRAYNVCRAYGAGL